MSMSFPKVEPVDNSAYRSATSFPDATEEDVKNACKNESDDEEEKDPNDMVPSQQSVISNQPMERASTDSEDDRKIKVGDMECPPTSLAKTPVHAESKLARVKSEEPIYDLTAPQQRLRQILDCIFLPTFYSVQKRKREEAEEDLRKVKLLKDPKIKKNVAALLPETLKDRLKPIGLDIQDQYFTVDQISRETMVTRMFMSATYGGNMQETFPRPSKAFLDIHGMDDFMFLPTEYQPEAPQLPGAPGLWFCTAPGDSIGQIMRVFVKIIPASGPKTGSRYQYVGMYQVHAANPPSLTVREWCDQPPRFHNKWAQAIVKMGWGAHVCARIFLRGQLDREPKPLEVEQAIMGGWHKGVTTDEVKEAYFQGKERMGVWTMKCVGYDNRFQKELHDTFPRWVPRPPKSGKKAVRKSQGTRTAAKRKPRISKQKRLEDVMSDTNSESDDFYATKNEISDSDEDDEPKPKRAKMDNDVIELWDSEEEEPVGYKGSGTRSRPISL